MSTTTLTGHDTLAHAARTGAQLHKHADPVDGARAVTLDEAREVARYDMGQRIREVEQGPAGDLWLLEDGAGARLLKLTDPSRAR